MRALVTRTKRTTRHDAQKMSNFSSLLLELHQEVLRLLHNIIVSADGEKELKVDLSFHLQVSGFVRFPVERNGCLFHCDEERSLAIEWLFDGR